MSNNENDDKELFLYYLNHGHLPKENINHLKKIESKENKNSINNKKENNNTVSKENIVSKLEEYDLEKEEAVWNEYIKNANFSNYIKPIYTKRQNHNNHRKIKLSKVNPNDKLDLHGTKYKDAKNELSSFLNKCVSKNYYCVIIVHGKGYGSEDGKSVLKELVEEYLIENKNEYRIQKYVEAPQNLGGSGAKIVFFKR